MRRVARLGILEGILVLSLVACDGDPASPDDPGTVPQGVHILVVSATGAGAGTVTSSPSGIGCSITAGSGSGACSAGFEAGTSVTLTASPSTGQTFTGWSGACSGTGSCTVAMTQARSVTATFAGSQVPFAGMRILWLGAHPDDEFMAAPMLAEACLHAGASCTLLVATQGGASCKNAPPPGLTCAEARAAEMVQSASLLGSSLIQWDLPNGGQHGTMSEARSAWSAAAGSEQALIASLRSAIDAVAPQVIVTFDPRHGESCHPEHRLVSELLLQALEGRAPQMQPMLRWRAGQYGSGGFDDVVVRADGGTLHVLDLNRPSPGGSGTYWSYLRAVFQVHRTQFSAADVALVDQVPAEHRVMYLLEPGPNVDTSVGYCAGGYGG